MDERTVSVQYVARRLRVSDVTVLNLIEAGELRAYQLRSRGWWHILESSLAEYEKKLTAQLRQVTP
jgi:excisionase family DNA binding protein